MEKMQEELFLVLSVTSSVFDKRLKLNCNKYVHEFSPLKFMQCEDCMQCNITNRRHFFLTG